MNPHIVERLASERQADFGREARNANLEAEARGGPLRLLVATALRGVADRLDGAARRESNRLGTSRALD